MFQWEFICRLGMCEKPTVKIIYKFKTFTYISKWKPFICHFWYAKGSLKQINSTFQHLGPLVFSYSLFVLWLILDDSLSPPPTKDLWHVAVTGEEYLHCWGFIEFLILEIMHTRQNPNTEQYILNMLSLLKMSLSNKTPLPLIFYHITWGAWLTITYGGS